jgi:PAS domain S-box-containing protein
MVSLNNSSDCYIGMGELSEESNFSYHRVCENIPVGIAVVDNKGNCHKVNSRLCGILGYSEPELLGTGFKELIGFKKLGIDSWPPDKNSQKTLKLQNEEKYCFKKDGSEIWISISPYLVIDSENIPNFVVFQIDDITKQKKANISFRAPGKSFDSIFENASDGIAINEQVGKFLEANQILCDKLGCTREELLQKTATEFISLDSSKIFVEQVRELYRNGQATVQITAICKGGALLPQELNMWLIEYKGKPAIFSIVSDITERKKIEQMVRRERNWTRKNLICRDIGSYP